MFAPVLGRLQNLFSGGINITECESELFIWATQRPRCCVEALVFSYGAFIDKCAISEGQAVVRFI